MRSIVSILLEGVGDLIIRLVWFGLFCAVSCLRASMFRDFDSVGHALAE